MESNRYCDLSDAQYVDLFDKLIEDDDAEREREIKKRFAGLKAEMAHMKKENQKLSSQLEISNKENHTLKKENEELTLKIQKHGQILMSLKKAVARKSEQFITPIVYDNPSPTKEIQESDSPNKDATNKEELEHDDIGIKPRKGGAFENKIQFKKPLLETSLTENDTYEDSGNEVICINVEKEERKKEKRKEKEDDQNESSEEQSDKDQDKFEIELESKGEFKRVGSVRDRIKNYQALIQKKNDPTLLDRDGNNNSNEKNAYTRRRPLKISHKITI